MWVNGGVWTTQEARAILAYFRTGRSAAAAASFNTMLSRFSRSWTMDAPLPDFGLTTWAHLPVMLTIDAFGCAAGMLRGLFEYLCVLFLFFPLYCCCLCVVAVV